MAKRYSKITTVNMVTAGTEYSFKFPEGTKAFELATRDGTAFKYAHVSGDIALDNYRTAQKGFSKVELGFSLDVGTYIYFSADVSGLVMEIEYTL